MLFKSNKFFDLISKKKKANKKKKKKKNTRGLYKCWRNYPNYPK